MPSEATGSYSTPVGLVYVFNLIIGTGALALPKAFKEAGVVLGIAVLLLSCFVSYMGATFVVESMSSANAVISHRKSVKRNSKVQDEDDALSDSSLSSEDSPLLTGSDSNHSGAGSFEIRKRVELSDMASVFLGKYGLIFFQLCLVVYLFGDLAIYSTVVPKSLMSLICTFAGPNNSCSGNTTLDLYSPCLNKGPAFLNRYAMYRFIVVGFAAVVCPFVFAGMTKTKYLQMFTTLSRWCAFILLIVLATRVLVSGKGKGKPPAADFSGFGKLFGISVYSFMCHHSLPSLVTPMKQKSRVHMLFMLIFLLILIFYATLAFTGTFAFENLSDVYTLNFVPPCMKPGTSRSLVLTVADYFLALFPVFTLSTNFPIVGITLRNNLRTLFAQFLPSQEAEYQPLPVGEGIPPAEQQQTVLIRNPRSNRCRFVAFSILIPSLVILPPICIALGTDNVEILASITGSYAGVGVQYVLPALLVIFSRQKVEYWLERSVPNSVASPFRARFWPILLLVWALVAVIIVSVNYIVVGVTKG